MKNQVQRPVVAPWTCQQLLTMSQSLAEACGALLSDNSGSKCRATWSAQQLVTLSTAKSSSLYW